MKKFRVYLCPTIGSSYRVTKTVNTLTVLLGEILTEAEVSALMRRPGFEITIHESGKAAR
jgi:hypothetical protein